MGLFRGALRHRFLRLLPNNLLATWLVGLHAWMASTTRRGLSACLIRVWTSLTVELGVTTGIGLESSWHAMLGTLLAVLALRAETTPKLIDALFALHVGRRIGVSRVSRGATIGNARVAPTHD